MSLLAPLPQLWPAQICQFVLLFLLPVLSEAEAAARPIAASGAATTPPPALPRLRINASEVSVSGISSGADFAVYFSIAHSASVMGSAVFAGNVYRCYSTRFPGDKLVNCSENMAAGRSVAGCNNVDPLQAPCDPSVEACPPGMGLVVSKCQGCGGAGTNYISAVNVTTLLRVAAQRAAYGAIDPLGHVGRGRYWLYRGAKDSCYNVGSVDNAAPRRKTDDNVAGAPNILFVLADDLGYGDVSSYPNPSDRRLHTPHIAALAAKGMRFTDAYAGYSVCAPSRRTLMAGFHSGHFNPQGNGATAILSNKSVTVAALLRGSEKKYRTRLIGKWGLDGSVRSAGGVPPTEGFPTLQGFDSFYGQSDQWQCHDYYPPFMYNDTANLTVVKNQGASNTTCGHDYSDCAWTGDLWTLDAVDWITASAKETLPWFLYLAFTSPHAGSVGSIELNDVPAPRVSVGPYALKPWPKVEIDFATAVTAIDAAVGKVVDAVASTGQGDNTIIFFASDNGAHQEGGHDHRFFNSSGYLNGFKRCIFDGGHRAAFIVRWDGHISPGKVSSHQLSFVDVLPTVAELAGIPSTALPPKIDGRSFVPTLLGKSQDQPPFIYHDYPHPIDAAFRRAASDPEGPHKPAVPFGQNIRMGKWSGVAGCHMPPCKIGTRNTTFFLFDMDVDQAQLHDVSADVANADIVKRINGLMASQYDHSWDPAMPPPGPDSEAQGAGTEEGVALRAHKSDDVATATGVGGRASRMKTTDEEALTAASTAAIPITVRRQYMSTVGRQEWIVNNTVAKWEGERTAIIVVDMWDAHWCKSDVTRIREIAVPMNHMLGAARTLGLHVVFAPSDVTSYYDGTPVRRRTLALPNVTLPPRKPKYAKSPAFPLGTATDGSCDDGTRSRHDNL